MALRFAGWTDASGAEQTVPGMVCVFSFFAVALVGFALVPRARLAHLGAPAGRGARPFELLLGKLALPAAMLLSQHVVLFAFGVLFLDLEVAGSWWAVVLISLTFGALVLTLGLAAAAALQTIQQVNAVTNLGAMIMGGLGGGFVPVDTLPGWVQPLAPLSPAYWAMEGYREAILEGGGIPQVATPVVVLVAWAVAFGAVAVWRLQLDAPKRTWG